jgi:diamine N-acetyltransferase
MIKFSPVLTKDQIGVLAVLADEIWHEHFIKILSIKQIDYMVEKFQSAPAMKEQIENQNYQYFFLEEKGSPIGYIGFKVDENKLFLSKIYILKKHRGSGYASQAFEFLEGLCAGMNLKAIWLTVNRFNQDTIKIYEKKGFEKIRTQVADIGQGYVMDDYIMEKKMFVI